LDPEAAVALPVARLMERGLAVVLPVEGQVVVSLADRLVVDLLAEAISPAMASATSVKMR
jgi:hypothetical protein